MHRRQDGSIGPRNVHRVGRPERFMFFIFRHANLNGDGVRRFQIQFGVVLWLHGIPKGECEGRGVS